MVQFVRCNALLSLAQDANGKGCRFVSKGASDDDVLKEMSSHITSVHKLDANDMKLNIMASIKTNKG